MGMIDELSFVFIVFIPKSIVLVTRNLCYLVTCLLLFVYLLFVALARQAATEAADEAT
jgi:hypothetical protein